MNRDHQRVQRLAALVLIAAGGAWLLAGPLNPPAGPVNAGGKTTQEIYDAVTGISGSIGAVGGRGPAVPGANTGAGTLVVAGAQGFSSAIIGMRLNALTATGGQTSLQNNGVTVVRQISAGSALAWRAETLAAVQTSATITVPSTGGNTTYVLTTVRIMGYRNYLVQRADGTFASIEEIDLAPTDLRVTDPSGTSWHWNFATNSGGV